MLKKIAKESPKAKIFAIYDCSRISCKFIPGIQALESTATATYFSVDEDMPCKYFHI